MYKYLNSEHNYLRGDFMQNRKEKSEDSTKYGEFISSTFTWLTPKGQKNRAEELDNATKVRKSQKVRKNEKNEDKE